MTTDMEKLCDLHTHSTASDGTATPAELVEAAIAAGLCAVALTDHSTMDGLGEFRSAAEKRGIEAVCGIEISAEYNGKELHIVGLFIKEEGQLRLDTVLSEVKRKKELSNVALAKALTAAGFNIDYERIKNMAGGYVNRSHFATALIEGGYAESINEAMKKYLSAEAGYYCPPEKLKAFDVIRLIREIGAVPVLAHPFLNLNEEELRAFLPEAKNAGLCAMETDYSEYSRESTLLARNIADSMGILRSGGSDWHGKRKPHISIGKGKGDLAVPYSYLEKLKNCINN